MNRVQPEDIVRILALLAEVEANPEIRVLVVASTGKAFSAGAHLHGMAQQAAAGGIKDTPGASFEDMINRLEMLKIPTIARLHGGVYGGSTDLALGLRLPRRRHPGNGHVHAGRRGSACIITKAGCGATSPGLASTMPSGCSCWPRSRAPRSCCGSAT